MNVAPAYVAVHVSELPAQALLRLRPEQAHAAVVVMEGEAPLERVCSMNAAARRLGVERGMMRPALEGMSGLVVLKRSRAEEESARAALLEVAGRFTPRVEVHAAGEAGFAMVLDMSGTARMFGETVVAVQRIVSAVRGLKLAVRVAASGNELAALMMAPFATGGPVIMPAGKEAEMLAPLPLHALPLAAEQAETFALWGLRDVGEFAVLSERDLIARLGQEGKRLRLLARGEHPHLMVPVEEPFTLAERMEFDAPVELLESLMFVLSPMLEQIVVRAGARALAIASVTVKLALDGGGEHERTVRPALPLMDRALLLKLVQLDLEAHPPGAAVVGIAITAEPGDRSKVQIGLFSPQLPEASRLDVTLARLSALVGEERVGRAKLLDAHGTERFAMERFRVDEERRRGARDVQREGRGIACRRLRPAVVLQMQLEGRQPRAFYWEQRRYAVERAFGPWRRSGEWWSNEVWSCEEWDIRALAKNGEPLLGVVTHDLLRSAWLLEALYD